MTSPSPKRFQQTIRQTMQELMFHHGYSRLDASKALVHAMASPCIVEPTEEEVTRIVNSIGIGSDEAKAALMVSASLDETCRRAKVTLSKALTEITKRITTKYVLEAATKEQGRDESDGAVSSDESILPPKPLAILPLASETPSIASMSVTAATTTESSSRALATPIKKASKPPATTTKATTSRKTRARLADITEEKPSTNVKTDQRAAMATRSRSDSVDTQVHHKLETAVTASAAVATSATVASSTRAKRSRSDDNTPSNTTAAATPTTSNKRSRSSRA